MSKIKLPALSMPFGLKCLASRCLNKESIRFEVLNIWKNSLDQYLIFEINKSLTKLIETF